ncbi:MAG: hypothetical protein RML35_12085 [Chloroherpetonaceae bacterium]|nr:hypothetical protein [Chloroherpetonaceae bacterium]
MRYRDVMKEIAEGKRYDNFSYEHAFKAVQYTYKIAEFQSPFIVVAENPCEMQMISNAMRALWKRKTTPFIQNLEDGVAEARKPEPDIEKLELLSKAVFRDALEYIKLVFNGTKVLENSAKRRPHISPDSHSSDPSEDLRHGLHDVIPSRLQQHEMLYLLTCNPKYVSSLSIYTDFYCIWIDEIRNILKQGKNAEKRLNSLLWLKDDEEYQTIWELHRKGGISSIICYPDVAVISKYPKRVYFNLERYSLHRLDGPAIEFGYSDPIFKRDAYYVNHRRILDEWIFDGFTLQEFLSVKNEDTRAAMY